MAEQDKDCANDALEGSLVTTLRDSELTGIATDVGEVALDALLDEEILKDIPVLGILAKGYNVFGTISNRLFAKKLLRFLSHLADVPVEQRREQIAKLTVDSAHQKNVGEQLLLILDRMNDMNKPVLLSLAFRAFLQGKIEYSVFQQIAHALDGLQMTTIERLKQIYDDENWAARINRIAGSSMDADPELQHLAFCGLLTIKWLDIESMGAAGGRPFGGYSTSTLGKTFCDILVFRKKDSCVEK